MQFRAAATKAYNSIASAVAERLTPRRAVLAGVSLLHVVGLWALFSYRIWEELPAEGPVMSLYTMPMVRTPAKRAVVEIPLDGVPFYLSPPTLPPPEEKPPEPKRRVPPPPPPAERMAEGALTPVVAANTLRARGVDLISPPDYRAAYLRNRLPLYPAEARRRREEGIVTVRVLVDSVGKPLEVSVYQSSGVARLDDSAIAAVKQWRFTPAERSGSPLSAWVLVSLSFIATSETAVVLESIG